MLLRDKVTFYLPIVRRLREWSDRKKWVDMPLLSGYIFVQPEHHKEREQILQLPNVVKFVRYNGADAIVRQSELDLLISLIEKGYDVSELGEHDEFVKGDSVEIKSGPMKGFNGTVIEIHGEKFAVITFEMIAQNVKVKLPMGIIKKM